MLRCTLSRKSSPRPIVPSTFAPILTGSNQRDPANPALQWKDFSSWQDVRQQRRRNPQRTISRPRPGRQVNRRTLTDANVFALSISGGPGCGKTSLIDATIQKLLPNVKVGVIACDVAAQLDSHRAARDQVVQIDTGQQGTPDATHIRDGLQHLNLTRLDLLLIENVGPLAGTRPLDLGQDATAAVFSVAGGHNKADKHPHLVKSADLVLLTKTDLLGAFPFQLEIFRGCCAWPQPPCPALRTLIPQWRRINPLAQLAGVAN